MKMENILEFLSNVETSTREKHIEVGDFDFREMMSCIEPKLKKLERIEKKKNEPISFYEETELLNFLNFKVREARADYERRKKHLDETYDALSNTHSSEVFTLKQFKQLEKDYDMQNKRCVELEAKWCALEDCREQMFEILKKEKEIELSKSTKKEKNNE